jgi:hypothetical protein
MDLRDIIDNGPGEWSISNNPLKVTSPPISPIISLASPTIPHDPILFPNSDPPIPTGAPLFRYDSTQGVVEARETEPKKQPEIAMFIRTEESSIKLNKERELRMMTWEQWLNESEDRRIFHEEELADFSEDSKKLETEQGRLSERHLKADIERKKQVLEELAKGHDWMFDCVCGTYGQINDGTHSIACDKCDIWQHSKCVGISPVEADREDFQFICTACQRRAKDAERAKNQPPMQVGKQVSAKRRLSESDILQNERVSKLPLGIVRPKPSPQHRTGSRWELDPSYFNTLNGPPVPGAQSYSAQSGCQSSKMTAAGFQQEPVEAGQSFSGYHPTHPPEEGPFYPPNETGGEADQKDVKAKDHQIGLDDCSFYDQIASKAVRQQLSHHAGLPAVSIPLDTRLVGRWICTGVVMGPGCGQEVNLELDGTTCPACGHIKCHLCPSITSPTDGNSKKLGDQHANFEWDVQSLASVNTFNDSALGSSLPSHISGSTTHKLPKTAQEEILLIFFSDQNFRSLLESAASLIDKSRFTRNIRRLLVPFQRELQATATDNREKDAAKIIDKHSQWLVSRLFDMSDPENKSNAHNMAAHLNQHIDKRPMLERYLASTVSKTAKVPQNSAEDSDDEDVEVSSNESDSNESEIDIENYINYSKFPNLEHIKNFIIGGVAFDNLKQNTFQFLNPQKPPIPLETELENALKKTICTECRRRKQKVFYISTRL